MALYRGTYYYASRCTGSARPGARALMSWYLGAYGSRGAANLGIYVCKRLGSGYSIHAEGRACDLGTSPYNDPGGDWPDWGWTLADALRRNSEVLGIQLIIFRGRVWSARYPDAGWRDYGGSDPHDGHMHVELTPEAAAGLTVSTIESRLGGSVGGIMFPKEGDRDSGTDETVEFWQRVLKRTGEELPQYGTDGDFGDETTAAVNSSRDKLGWDPVDPGKITAAHAVKLHEQAFGGGGVSSSAIEAAVADYLETHPPEPGRDGKTPTRVKLAQYAEVTEVE